jgi:hypothetical protein
MSEAPSKDGVYGPQSYLLEQLMILTQAGPVDMKAINVELHYDEDLFNNSCLGQMMVTDAAGLLEAFQFSGNEFLYLTLSKGNKQDKIDKIFRIYKVAKRKPEGQGLTESFVFYFCSEELMLSEQYKICKSYKGKKVKDIVQDIASNYLKIDSSKIANLEDTFGTYDFIIPNLKPFDAINWLMVYARPNDTKAGADMLFYEDRDGFRMQSLQSLYQQQSIGSYTFSTKNTESIESSISDIQTYMTSARSYEILDSFDTLGATNLGMYANSLLNVDILARKSKLIKYDYKNDYFMSNLQLNQEAALNTTVKNRIGDTPNKTHLANFKMIFANSYEKNLSDKQVARDIFADVYVPHRTAQLPLANYTRMKISVWGDPSLTVGKVIDFNLLSYRTKNRSIDPFYSGKYIITAVKHKLTPTDYVTILEIAKDSNTYPHASADPTSSVMANAVKGLKK